MMTSLIVHPRSSSDAFIVLSAARICSTTSSETTFPSGPIPAVPATRTTEPWRIAREKPNWNSPRLPVVYMYRFA